MTGKQDEARRKRMRRLLQDAEPELRVAGEDLRWLLDETSRLQQSNDRLRRQNRRLRLRQDGKGGSEAVSDSDSGGDDGAQT